MQDNSIHTPNHTEFLQIIEHFPQLVFWVSASEHIFLGCNTKFAEFLGLKDPSEIIGKDGFKYFKEEDVLLFRGYKDKALESKQKVLVNEDIQSIGSDELAVDLTIAPILDQDNNVTSTICYGTLVLQLSDKKWSHAIKLITKENIDKLLARNSKFIVDSKDMGTVSLTKREAECALFLLKGLTAKSIAEEIFLAQRTVINHIENIKDKLGCAKREELISALTEGHFIDHNF